MSEEDEKGREIASAIETGSSCGCAERADGSVDAGTYAEMSAAAATVGVGVSGVGVGMVYAYAVDVVVAAAAACDMGDGHAPYFPDVPGEPDGHGVPAHGNNVPVNVGAGIVVVDGVDAGADAGDTCVLGVQLVCEDDGEEILAGSVK